MGLMATAPVLAPTLEDFIPASLRNLGDHQTALPRIARDPALTAEIEAQLGGIPTSHNLYHADARRHTGDIEPESVHLVLTSPPYWTLKEYRRSDGQLGFVADYGAFIHELEKVWKHCWKALAPGGRLVIVVGDVCLSRRQNDGRHTVVPLHASITESCRKLGFDNLAPIFWYKISNAAYEVENGSRFLGKPYEPNGVIKNDVEYILMQRKPGAYRKPTLAARVLSVISAANHQKWFQQIWSDVTGASTREHPAPYPLELADRLVRMFSFVGDTVLDPFLGTGTTSLAAAKCGRNSVGIEVDAHYLQMAEKRLITETTQLWGAAQINLHRTSADTGRKSSR